ncbi:MAG TPA: hypothetical protein VJA44_00975 [Acidimicrobiia bacterium]|nr:hypothetical protein [Acidimicrobiia bacterium]
MTSVPPPPPPPPPEGITTPWYKANGMPLILGILAAAAVAIPAYIFLSADDEPAASGSSTTTTAGSTTTNAGTTTTASGTTAASTTTAGVTTTTAGTTTTTPGASTTTTTTTTPVTTELDTGLPANYGSTTLAAGFTPDPASQVMTSGGPVDVSYLGGPCLGWATAAPDVEIVWTGSTGGLLRFYFIADGLADDTVLIINDTAGAWWCVDDSFATANPTIDFATGPNGTYDVWVASYSSSSFHAGTLYVTELSANHP